MYRKGSDVVQTLHLIIRCASQVSRGTGVVCQRPGT
jgi:hypothetical protein